MKKSIYKICTVLLITSSISINASAATDTDRSYKSKLPTLSTESNILDKERSSVTLTLSSSVDIEYAFLGFGTDKIISKSSCIRKDTGKSYTIDFISAKARHYDSNGAFQGSKIDEQKYASYAGISYDTGTNVAKGIAYGNHVYKSSGMNSVYHETQKNFK